MNKNNEICFREYLKEKSPSGLGIIYQIFQNTHISYRTSYDNALSAFIGAIIGFFVAIAVAFLFNGLDFILNYSILSFLGIFIIISFIVILILFLLQSRKKKNEADNLKKKKECITDEINSRIKFGKWK